MLRITAFSKGNFKRAKKAKNLKHTHRKVFKLMLWSLHTEGGNIRYLNCHYLKIIQSESYIEASV